MDLNKIQKILIYIKYYFSFICNIPTELNKPIVIIGIQAERAKEILFVWPRAKDKSLK